MWPMIAEPGVKAAKPQSAASKANSPNLDILRRTLTIKSSLTRNPGKPFSPLPRGNTKSQNKARLENLMIAKLAAFAALIAMLALIACSGSEPIADNVPTAPAATSAPIEAQSPTSGATNLHSAQSQQTPDLPTNQENPEIPPLISAREVTPPTLEAFREELSTTQAKTPNPDQSPDQQKSQSNRDRSSDAGNIQEDTGKKIPHLEMGYTYGINRNYIFHYSPHTHKNDLMATLFYGSFLQAPTKDDLGKGCWATMLASIGSTLDNLGCQRGDDSSNGHFDLRKDKGRQRLNKPDLIEGLIKHPFQVAQTVDQEKPDRPPEGSFKDILLKALANALEEERPKLGDQESIQELLYKFEWDNKDGPGENEARSHWDFDDDESSTVNVHVYGSVKEVSYIFGFQVTFQYIGTEQRQPDAGPDWLCPAWAAHNKGQGECPDRKSQWDFMPKRVHKAYLILPESNDDDWQGYQPIPIELDYTWEPDQDRSEVMGYQPY